MSYSVCSNNPWSAYAVIRKLNALRISMLSQKEKTQRMLLHNMNSVLKIVLNANRHIPGSNTRRLTESMDPPITRGYYEKITKSSTKGSSMINGTRTQRTNFSAILKAMRVVGSGDPIDCQPEGISLRDSNCFVSLLLRPWTTTAVQMRPLRIEESCMIVMMSGLRAPPRIKVTKRPCDPAKCTFLKTQQTWEITSTLRHEVETYILVDHPLFGRSDSVTADRAFQTAGYDRLITLLNWSNNGRMSVGRQPRVRHVAESLRH
jgi:hypothetical protein